MHNRGVNKCLFKLYCLGNRGVDFWVLTGKRDKQRTLSVCSASEAWRMVFSFASITRPLGTSGKLSQWTQRRNLIIIGAGQATRKPSLAKWRSPSSGVGLAAVLLLLTYTYTVGMQCLAYEGSKVATINRSTTAAALPGLRNHSHEAKSANDANQGRVVDWPCGRAEATPSCHSS